MSAVAMETQPEQVQQQLFPNLEPEVLADPDGLHAALRDFDEFGTRSISCTSASGSTDARFPARCASLAVSMV